MDPTHAQFIGSIPEHYDRFLGAVLFEPYARDLAARLPSPPARRVLELACGTGILTRELRSALPDAEIIATDLNQAMVDFARERPDAAPAVEWKAADMGALPFPDRSFDGAACQFGLMFVPDKPAALREVRRILRPGGFFLFNVWDSLDQNAFARITNDTVMRLFPSDPPTFYRTPFSLFDTGKLRNLLTECGFEAVGIERVKLRSTATAAADFALGLVEGNPLKLAILERGTVPIERVRKELEECFRVELGDHPVRVDLNAFVFLARAGRD